jgi:hypothetical protein
MRNLALIILLFALLSSNSASFVKAQGGDAGQRVKALVSQLSWKSILGREDGLVWSFYPDGEAALKLIEIGKPATNELLNVLEDESRGVAAHIILTQIWKPIELGEYGESSKGNPYKLKSLIVTYTYNGLEWTWKPKKGYKVEKAALAENANRWRRKMAELRGNSNQ